MNAPRNALALCALCVLGALASMLVVDAATEVEICGVPAAKRRAGAAGASGDDVDLKDKEHYIIGNCTKPPCRLRRKHTITVDYKFKPDKDVKTLRNEVNAKILGIPFPFLGVDNTNACGSIYLADGKTKAPCPLKAGTEYVYKNKFDILEVYPKVKLLVHWALVTSDNERITCFNVPAKITS